MRFDAGRRRPTARTPVSRRRDTRRRGAVGGLLLSTALVSATVLTSCVTPGDTTPTAGPTSPAASTTTSTDPTSSATTMAGVPAALVTFYGQQLDWSGCEAGAECAELTVPIDYAKPDGPTVKIHVLRQRATGTKIGSLIVNPGGPGGSGAEYAMGADRIVGQPVRRAFDIVGFDPRGVGKSRPLKCLSDSQVDAMLALDPTPDTPAEEEAVLAVGKTLGDGCLAGGGDFVAHLSTVEVAKDMDVLRAVLGDKKINYLGKSYGTFIGATYADLFPGNVGRMVLDGAIAPDLTNEEVGLGQAQGFETATRAYVQDCIDRGDCFLGATVDEGMAALRQFFKDLDSNPIKSGDASVPALTEGWAVLGVAEAMYQNQAWPMLTNALKDAKAGGDGKVLMHFADLYAGRRYGGGYDNNLMQVISAVNCLDRPEPDATAATYEAQIPKFAAVAPTWGPMMAWGAAVCAKWPVKGPYGPKKITAAGADPIVVVGTTRDPATPYQWAVRLRDQLASGVLVTYDGDGHTAYMRSNTCVQDPIDAYYTTGTVPKDGLRC